MNDLQIHHRLQNKVAELKGEILTLKNPNRQVKAIVDNSENGKLKARIVKLEALVIKHRNNAQSANATKDKNIQKGNRTFKAKVLLGLKHDDVIDWGFDKVASECFLSVDYVVSVSNKMKRDQK